MLNSLIVLLAADFLTCLINTHANVYVVNMKSVENSIENKAYPCHRNDSSIPHAFIVIQPKSH
jgi:hypothetical protein